ncbi:MAG: carboxymuconolactone decarboxylase family protein [Rhodothalassiaceae bacterium]
MPHFSFLADGATMAELMARRPDRFAPLARLTDEVMCGPSPLDRGTRELIAAYVSGLNGCRYCFGAHVAFAESHGIDPDLLRALLDDPEKAPVDAPLRALLAFCRKLTDTPSRIVAGDVADLGAAGWSEAAVEDAIAVVALFGLYNRMMDGYGIEPRAAAGNRERAALIRDYGYDFTRYPEDRLMAGSPLQSGAKDPKA